MSIGECISEARKYRRLTQPQLLVKLGLSPVYPTRISVHETGKYSPTMENIQAYADALEVVFTYRPKAGWSWKPA